ncbi:hypothetical protein [Micromonospora sp. KC213]|uniref:hypothetical protein n=1 Tax=Micromonospora sp. KC213 TaxID=2530378 RepID=UPI001A9D4088|nr:hypothetical protein [Micromonospora sp. KC213]
MFEVLAFLVLAGCVAAIASRLVWLGSRACRRGVGVEVMGPFEEIWHPGAHRCRAEIRQQEQRMVPMPSPDDQEPRGRPGKVIPDI